MRGAVPFRDYLRENGRRTRRKRRAELELPGGRKLRWSKLLSGGNDSWRDRLEIQQHGQNRGLCEEGRFPEGEMRVLGFVMTRFNCVAVVAVATIGRLMRRSGRFRFAREKAQAWNTLQTTMTGDHRPKDDEPQHKGVLHQLHFIKRYSLATLCSTKFFGRVLCPLTQPSVTYIDRNG